MSTRRALALIVALLAVAGTAAAATVEEADALFAEADWPAAESAYDAVTAADAGNGHAWLRLGQVRLRLHRPEEAADALEHAWTLEQQPAVTAFSLARAHAFLGDADRTIEWLERSAEHGATFASAVTTLPELALVADRPELGAIIEEMRPCSTPEHHQFDFWLGTWEVHAASRPDAPPSHNAITSIQDGCVVHEQYRSIGGYTGTSMSYYDAATGTWYQTWVDNQGQPLRLSGGLEGGSMVMSSDPERSPVDRVTWTPNRDGTVRQLWEQSADGGATWKVVFDGTYRKEGSDGQ